MGIRGDFDADFGKFTAAVDAAETKLVSFESGSKKVETALNRMTDGFSGRKVISEATIMAEAVERAGGASTLTAKELATVAAKAAEAEAKLRAIGQDVPPGIAKLAAEVKTTGGVMDDLKRLATGAAGALAAMFSINAIRGAIGGLIEYAGGITDLSAKTGIGTTALQQLEAAGAAVGVSLESITGATAKLENNIGSGDKGATGALKALGISFDKIRDAKPDEQFRMVAEKLKGVEDQTAFVKIGMDLMGKGFMEVAPLIRSDLDDLIAGAERLGVVLDEQTIANLDDLGDSLTALQGVGRAVLADLLAPMVPALTSLANGLMGVGHWVKDAQTAFEQLLSIGAGGIAWMETQAVKVLTLTNAYGMNDKAIASLKESSAQWTYVSNDLSVSQDKVAKKTDEAGAAARRVRTDYDAVAAAEKKMADEAEAAAKKIVALQDHLFGKDTLDKAAQYASVLGNVSNASKLTKDAQAELNAVMVAAVEVLQRQGMGSSELAAKYQALAAATLDVAKAHKDLDAIAGPIMDRLNAKRDEAYRKQLTQTLDVITGLKDTSGAYVETATEAAASAEATNAAMLKSVASIHTVPPAAEGAAKAIQGSFTTAYATIELAATSLADKQKAIFARMGHEREMFESGIFIATSSGGSIEDYNRRVAGRAGLGGMAEFAEGGEGYFGSGTPVMLHGHERIIPLDGPNAGGGGSTINAPITINVGSGGDPAAAGRAAADALLAHLKRSGVRL